MIHRLRRGPQALRDDRARKLRAVVARAAARVPIYRRWLAGVDLSRLRGPEDLGLLPLLAKRDLRAAPLADGNPVRITLVASHGTLTLSGTAGLNFLVGDGTADAAMSFTGTIAAINAALAGLVFDPEPGYSGPASLDITTDDLGNTGAGGPLSDSDTLAIEVARPLSVVEIPTLGGWGLLLLASGLAFAAAWRLR